MEPQLQRENHISKDRNKHPVFAVTKTSKYLAMLLFISMPFIGGYIGYTNAPTKIVELEKIVLQKDKTGEHSMFLETTVNLCGKLFKTNVVYIDGVDAGKRTAELLTQEYTTSSEQSQTACYYILQNQNTDSFTTLVHRVKYDYSPKSSAIGFEAYLTTMETQDGATIGEGTLIDKKTLEVFRVNEMDGSKGISLGSLNI